MPNWCKGVLKIRGKKENLINLIQNEIERYGFPSTTDSYTKYPLDLKIDEYGDVFVNHTDNEHNSWLYFKDSRRLFIEENIEWYFDDYDEEEIHVLDIKQAWRLEPEYFVELSKKYKYHESLHRYCSYKPSLTIDTGHRTHFHYKWNRIPTVRECARLQSFPDDFIFYGTKVEQYKQVGNAVPPLLGKAVALKIREFLDEEKV